MSAPEGPHEGMERAPLEGPETTESCFAHPVRIIHGADVHLGRSWTRFGTHPALQQTLEKERLDALERLIEEANRTEAHLVVIAGDLFDKAYGLPARLINATIDILARLHADSVCVLLPGNHDHLDNRPDSVWQLCRKRIGSLGSLADRLLILDTAAPVRLTLGQVDTILYPCPCPSRHGTEALTGWVTDYPKAPACLHLGIAHGNVEGHSIDEEGRYFTMMPRALSAAGCALWLLGHVHAPHPVQAQDLVPDYLFPGTTAADGYGCRHAGWALALELDAPDRRRMRQIPTGHVRFMDLQEHLTGPADITRLAELIPLANAGQTVARLTLTGHLDGITRARLDEWLSSLQGRCLHLDIDMSGLREAIDVEYVRRQYAPGSLEARLLEGLLADSDSLAVGLVVNHLLTD